MTPTTTPKSSSGRAESLVRLRLQEHLQELHHLLAEVRRKGWALEQSQVREAIAAVEDLRPLPPRADGFHALALAQQRCLRDVRHLRQAAFMTVRRADQAAGEGLAGFFSRLFHRAAPAV